MCTVSYVPLTNGFLLTSSRDEQKKRPTAPPQPYLVNEQEIIFPKDLQSGGTWIALSPNESRAACLLNGAYENHEKKAYYRKSRGQILLDSFAHKTTEAFYELLHLEDIEPFTLLLIDNQKTLKINELRWDGTRKHFSEIDLSSPHIWSSATLYEKEIREQRKEWFKEWLSENEWQFIAQFHAQKKGIEAQNDLVMERSGGLQTVSISQIKCNETDFEFHYTDLVENKTYTYLQPFFSE